jgi:hypothetical protein
MTTRSVSILVCGTLGPVLKSHFCIDALEPYYLVK